MRKNIWELEEIELVEIIKKSRKARDEIRRTYLSLLTDFVKDVLDEEDAAEISGRVLESALHSSMYRPYFSSFDVWLFSWLQDNIRHKKLSKAIFFSLFDSIDVKEERRLLECYIKGEEATEVLYKRYSRYVASKVIKAGGSKKDIEDLSQEIFQLAFSNICQLKNAGSFKYWLGKISSHHAYRYRKKSEKISELSLDVITENNPGKFSEDLSENTNPLKETLKEEEKILLKKELNLLDEKYKIAIYLKYFRDMTYKEISRVLQVDADTVYKRVFYGLKKLRSALSR